MATQPVATESAVVVRQAAPGAMERYSSFWRDGRTGGNRHGCGSVVFLCREGVGRAGSS